MPATSLNGPPPTEVGVGNGVELKENVGGGIVDIASVVVAEIDVGVIGLAVGVASVGVGSMVGFPNAQATKSVEV